MALFRIHKNCECFQASLLFIIDGGVYSVVAPLTGKIIDKEDLQQMLTLHIHTRKLLLQPPLDNEKS